MRPMPTYADPVSPSRQEGLSKRQFQSCTRGITARLFDPDRLRAARTTWDCWRRLQISEALCRIGAGLGNWTDAALGQQRFVERDGRRLVVRSRAWCFLGAVATWLYLQPERSRP